MFMFILNICIIICWVWIDQRVGCETSEPGYELAGYERSMGMKQLDTIQNQQVELEPT